MNRPIGPRGLTTPWRRLVFILALGLATFALFRLVFEFLPSFGLPPCEAADWLYDASHVSELVLIASSFLSLFSLARGRNPQTLATALLLPSTALVLQEFSASHYEERQATCAARSLDQAMAFCDADPRHYRRGEDSHGNPTLTVTAPGTTDAAWVCLSRWADHSHDVSVGVDESVYETSRRNWHR